MMMRETLKIGLIMLTLTVGGLTACANDATAEGTRAGATQAEAPKAAAAPAVATGEPKDAGTPTAFDAAPAVGTKARCPVMGGEFTVSESTERSEYEGKHYAFCCPGCKPSFDAAPEKFLEGGK